MSSDSPSTRMYPQPNRADRQLPPLPDRQVTGDPLRGRIDRISWSPHHITIFELKYQEPHSQQQFKAVAEATGPIAAPPYPNENSIPEVVFGISGDEMRRLLAADEEEDRAIFEQMFAASFLRRTTDASEDD